MDERAINSAEPGSLADATRAMSASFVGDLASKIERLKKSLANLAASPASQEALREIELTCQDLMSSAAAGGSPEVSEYASMILKALLVIKNNELKVNSKVLALIAQALKYFEIILIQAKRGKVIIDYNNPAVQKLKIFETELAQYREDTKVKKILVVDDDPDILRLVEVVLKRSGFLVVTAKNGMDALSYLQSDVPSMILLDVAMPGMNGFEVLGKLKGEERMRQVPVMMLTARSQKEEIVKAIQLGAQNYMVKPFDSRELITRIKKIIGE